MTNQKIELQVIVERLERVEKENRWFKRLLAALVLVPIALLVMGQARVPSRKIEAQEFVLVDAAGRKQAVFQSVDGWPGLKFFNPGGRMDASFSLSTLGPSLSLGPPGNSERILISSFHGGGPSVDIAIPGNHASFGFFGAAPGLLLGTSKEGDSASILVSAAGPMLLLHDKNGFEAQLGVASTVNTITGESHKTSAASLIMFGKDNKVLWSAP